MVALAVGQQQLLDGSPHWAHVDLHSPPVDQHQGGQLLRLRCLPLQLPALPAVRIDPQRDVCMVDTLALYVLYMP